MANVTPKITVTISCHTILPKPGSRYADTGCGMIKNSRITKKNTILDLKITQALLNDWPPKLIKLAVRMLRKGPGNLIEGFPGALLE
jgi:hypothetical protein